MKTYENHNADGVLQSFEVPNSALSRRAVVRILKSVPDLKILREPKIILSWFREDVFCEFEFAGVRYQVEEPFGDNSRFWVGGSETTEEFEIVANAFRKAKWPFKY